MSEVVVKIVGNSKKVEQSISRLSALFKSLSKQVTSSQTRVTASITQTTAALRTQLAVVLRLAKAFKSLNVRGIDLAKIQSKKTLSSTKSRKDPAQFVGVPRRPDIQAPVGSPIRQATKDNTLTQKALADESKRLQAQEESFIRQRFQHEKTIFESEQRLQKQKSERAEKERASQFVGVPRRPDIQAPVGTSIKDVTQEGTFTQKTLAGERKRLQAQEESLIRQQFQREKAKFESSQRLEKQNKERADKEQARSEKQDTREKQQLANKEKRAEEASQREAARSRRAVFGFNRQSQSLTLLVAKFALMTFAIQTVGNIFNSTFGALLRTIDDFKLAAIGTASAITTFTSETDRPLGEVFVQNLAAAEDRFAKLDIVAAKFFATGQELQLAFNTFAQRGVVIREDELDTLGRLTDQIILLTGAQNRELQIGQEIRAVLDGQIRPVDKFAKSLQDRGADIRQIQKEIRATGSIKVLEEFLKGLEPATGAIQRTLSSVTTTFTSLFKLLSRDVFAKTFNDTVSAITRVNNILIDNRELIVQIGKFLVSRVRAGFEQLIPIAQDVFRIFSTAVESGVAQMLAVIKLVSFALSSGPLGAILAIAAALSVAAGDAGSFGDSLSIAFGILEILLIKLRDALEDAFQGLKGLAKFGRLLQTGDFSLIVDFSSVAAADRKIQILQDRIEQIKRGGDISPGKAILSPVLGVLDPLLEALAPRSIDDLQQQIEELKKERDAAAASFQTNPEGKTFLQSEQVISATGGGTLAEFLKDTRASVEATVKSLKGGGAEAGDGFIERLQKASAAFAQKLKESGLDFTNTVVPTSADTRIQEATLAAQRAFQDLERKGQEDQAQQLLAIQLANLKKLNERQVLSAKQVIDQEQQLRDAQNAKNILALQREIQLVEDRREEELRIARENLKNTAGPTKLQQTEFDLTNIRIRSDATSKIQTLEQSIAKIRGEADKQSQDAAAARIAAAREVSRLLKDRELTISEGGQSTNADQLARVREESRRAIADFNRKNPGASPEQQQKFVDQQKVLSFAKLVDPEIDAFISAFNSTIDAVVNGIVEGTFEFKSLAKTLSKDLIKSGLVELITQARKAIGKGLTKIFSAFGEETAKAAGQALALGLGLLLAVLSRAGNKGEFTATGGQGGGSSISNSRQVQGIIGGETSLPLAEINVGLKEAMIPTNALLTQIERNTRALSSNAMTIDPGTLQQALAAQLNVLFAGQMLQS